MCTVQVTLLTFGMEDTLQIHEMIQCQIILLKLPLTSVVVSHILDKFRAFTQSYLNTESLMMHVSWDCWEFYLPFSQFYQLAWSIKERQFQMLYSRLYFSWIWWIYSIPNFKKVTCNLIKLNTHFSLCRISNFSFIKWPKRSGSEKVNTKH